MAVFFTPAFFVATDVFFLGTDDGVFGIAILSCEHDNAAHGARRQSISLSLRILGPVPRLPGIRNDEKPGAKNQA
ncbi:MAG: hypothetical protein J0G37_12915 [Afipia sp.]|nr:hypothetical protein [Afipia sp.]